MKKLSKIHSKIIFFQAVFHVRQPATNSRQMQFNPRISFIHEEEVSEGISLRRSSVLLTAAAQLHVVVQHGGEHLQLPLHILRLGRQTVYQRLATVDATQKAFI